jgi:hypothetical protein
MMEGEVPDTTDVTLFDDEVVCVNLDLGPYVLVRGYSGDFGLPAEAFTQLFAVRDGRPVGQIAGPQDLSRFVSEVHTLAQALAFVDLFTSASTHFLFPDYTHVIELTVRRLDRRDRPGAITPDVAEDWSLEPASAREAVEHFVIGRNLLVRAQDDLEARRVSEEVGRDGTYAQTDSSSVRRLSPTDVIFPTYE